MNYFERLILRSSASQAGHYGKNGPAIIAEVWPKLRCIASNYWGINSVQENLIAKSMKFMHV